MAYSRRTPPIKLVIGFVGFNILLSTLEKAINTLAEKNKRLGSAKRLKEKLLRYSVPKEDEVEIGLFPSEAGELIELLLVVDKEKVWTIDYYSVLVRVHNALKNDAKRKESG